MIRSLNLDLEFHPSKYAPIRYELVSFNGGELHPKLDKNIPYNKIEKVVITHRVNNSDALMMVVLFVDALRRVGIKRIELIMPYIPYARQDRYDLKKQFGESFSLKMFARILNSLNLDKIYSFDAHSDVSKALIDNCIDIDNHEYVDRMLRDIFENVEDPEFHLVAIDAGVAKKIDDLATCLWRYGWRNFDIIQCIKRRNIQTGAIEGFTVYSDDLKNLPCIIVDDICDGGASFIHAANGLKEKNAGRLALFVSHGIFANGFDALNDKYLGIYTTNTIRDIDSNLLTYQYEFTV